MSQRESIFLAKKLFAELVYNTALIEGVNVTFPQTQTIIDGGVVNNVPSSEVQTVLNLRNGWQYAINHLDAPLDLGFVCKINELVSAGESLAWGELRSGEVHVGGTDYIPPVPVKAEVEAKISDVAKIQYPIERALEYFCYAVRAQLFWDGNKRTSTIVASKILIESGDGVLTIDAHNAEAFNTALQKFYDTDDSSELRAVLRNCIKTMP